MGIVDAFLWTVKLMADVSMRVRTDSTAAAASFVARGDDLMTLLVVFAINFKD